MLSRRVRRWVGVRSPTVLWPLDQPLLRAHGSNAREPERERTLPPRRISPRRCAMTATDPLGHRGHQGTLRLLGCGPGGWSFGARSSCHIAQHRSVNLARTLSDDRQSHAVFATLFGDSGEDSMAAAVTPFGQKSMGFIDHDQQGLSLSRNSERTSPEQHVVTIRTRSPTTSPATSDGSSETSKMVSGLSCRPTKRPGHLGRIDTSGKVRRVTARRIEEESIRASVRRLRANSSCLPIPLGDDF